MNQPGSKPERLAPEQAGHFRQPFVALHYPWYAQGGKWALVQFSSR